MISAFSNRLDYDKNKDMHKNKFKTHVLYHAWIYVYIYHIHNLPVCMVCCSVAVDLVYTKLYSAAVAWEIWLLVRHAQMKKKRNEGLVTVLRQDTHLMSTMIKRLISMMYYRNVLYESIYINVLVVDVCHILSDIHTYLASTNHYYVNIIITIT